MTEAIIILTITCVVVAATGWLLKNDGTKVAPAMFVIALLAALASGLGFCLYQIVEAPFAYIDNILAVITAAIFSYSLYLNGTYEYLLQKIESKSRTTFSRTVLLLLLVALPGILTGTAIASVATTGLLVARQLSLEGMSRKGIVEFVAAGSVLGMLMPPLCWPVMIVVVSRSGSYPATYNGYFLALLLISLPAFFVYAAAASKKITQGGIADNIGTNGKCVAPIIIVTVLILAENFLCGMLPFMGYPVIYLIGIVLVVVMPAKKFTIGAAAGEAILGIAPTIAMGFAGGAMLEILTMTGSMGTLCTKMISVAPTTAAIIFIVIVAIGSIPFGAGFATTAALIGSYVIGALAYNIEPLYLVAIGAVLGVSALLTTNGDFITSVKSVLGYDDVNQHEVVKGLLSVSGTVVVTAVIVSVLAVSLLVLIV